MSDLVRHLSSFDLSEDAVMAVPLREARRSMVPFRVAAGFVAEPVGLLAFLTCPADNLKLSHSETDRVAGYGLTLAPATASMFTPFYSLVLSGALSERTYFAVAFGSWNTCRYSTPGCRSACLATSGNGRYDATQLGRVWKTHWLANRPAEFLRFLAAAIDAIPVDAWGEAGFTVSFRANVLSDLPWETVAPWILRRIADRGIRAMDYTAWPSARRSRAAADAVGLYLVDSVKETHTDAQIRRMARPVVVFDVKRGAPLPETYLGRPVIDADRSDARFLDADGTVRGLRYKEVQTTKRAAAVASGFVKVAR